MDITYISSIKTKQQGFRRFVAEKLKRTLARFSDRIIRVDVVLNDENGPKGGVDKNCRVKIYIPGQSPVIAWAVSDNPWAAVAITAKRARRALVTKLDRYRMQRVRPRMHRGRFIENNKNQESALDTKYDKSIEL